MPTRPALARFLAASENRCALAAIQDVLFGLAEDRRDECLLYLHGPSGSGKTSLLAALREELALAGIEVCTLSANDFADQIAGEEARLAELLIVEDLQHLPLRYADALIGLIDERLQRGLPMIFTALHGPSRLAHRGQPLGYRLTNRLAGGLVVALESLKAPSRRRLLEAQAKQAKLTVAPEILDWLAEHLIGGGRQLEGAIRQLQALQRLQPRPLRLGEVRAHFAAQLEAHAPTLKRIAEQVSGYFQVAPRQMLSARRSRDVLLPRQVAMYLARQLTGLSLQKIGLYIGGRDHKTVQHACQKVEIAMKTDTALSGAVRQLTAQLT